MFMFQHCGIPSALLCSSFLPVLTCLLCLVSISLFVIYRVISAVLRGSCLLVIACMSFAFCQMINKEMLFFAECRNSV